MIDSEISEQNIFGMQDLKSLKKRPDILSQIKLDVTPQMVMEPRFHSKPEDVAKVLAISGYVFYIETQGERPALMLMKVDRTDVADTIGSIDEIPPGLLQQAIDNPVSPPCCGMVAITEEIKDWLRRELAL